MKAITKFILGIFIISLIACENDEPATVAYGDAYITVKVVEQDTVYGLFLHAYSNKNFIKVSVSPDEDTDITYELSSASAFKNEFYYETDEDKYQQSIPQTGNYTFSATIEGNEPISFSDKLTDDTIDPPAIVECIYDETDKRIELEWEKDNDADIYNIRIYDEDDKMVFSSAGFEHKDERINITSSTQGWLNSYTPSDGKTYTVELNAYLFESVRVNMDIQCKSSSTHDIVWGS